MFEPPVQRLIDELARLPGIGQKSATRLAFHIVRAPESFARSRASSSRRAVKRARTSSGTTPIWAMAKRNMTAVSNPAAGIPAIHRPMPPRID